MDRIYLHRHHPSSPCPIVVVYLEATQYWSDVPPVKNALHGLCKELRNYSNAADPRIFIANHLPRVSASPLRKQITQTNFILQQAVRSVGRSLGRVFELSLYEHFTSRHGSLLKPVSKYLHSEQLPILDAWSWENVCCARWDLRDIGLTGDPGGTSPKSEQLW